jgi:transcriptional regulator NrdR family protein
MKITVIKKNGAKEPWDGEKLRSSIIAAAKDAGINKERTKTVADNISQKVIDQFCSDKEVTSYMIREIVLRELRNIENGASDAWMEYERTKKAP